MSLIMSAEFRASHGYRVIENNAIQSVHSTLDSAAHSVVCADEPEARSIINPIGERCTHQDLLLIEKFRDLRGSEAIRRVIR